jgi:peptidoglycan/xylan/chitin deacetylase (PgdA/CDA1 family)
MQRLDDTNTLDPSATGWFVPRWQPAPAIRLSIWLHVLVIPTGVAWPALWLWLLAAVLGNHLLLGLFGMWPRSRILGDNLSKLPRRSRAKRQVALTFDDGPDPDVTPIVLDLLDRYAAKATFFCIGQRVAAYPELVRDIIRRGHSVENHSYRHPYAFACYPLSALKREIEETQREIYAITGSRPTFFRAPMGLRSPLLDFFMAQSSLRYVSWTRRGLDCFSRDPAAVLQRLIRGLAAGDVLLLHDGSCARMDDGDPVLLAVLPSLLEHLARRKLQSVSLPIACANS